MRAELWLGALKIGAPSMGQCKRDALPGMTGCHEHVTPEAMALHIRQLWRNQRKAKAVRR